MNYYEQFLESREPIEIEPTADYLGNGTYHADSLLLKSDMIYKTGYENLDDISSFYSGFYILGAVPSLGKTTFTLQLADQLAAQDRHVLYFSLEQSRAELVSKSISRTLCQIYRESQAIVGKPQALRASALQVRTKYLDDAEVAGAIDRYRGTVGNRMHIISSSFSLSVSDIREAVEKWIENNNGVKPVVIVDYLQILEPTDVRLSDKMAVDKSIKELKTMQRENGITVIAISSLNRDNYLSTLDFVSFKESGAIEYGADVVWGLQLSAMHSHKFSNCKDKNEKRKIYNKAKEREVREITLICLKNRYGKNYYEAAFNYFPAYDLFAPCEPSSHNKYLDCEDRK